jgi:hypothetical protein
MKIHRMWSEMAAAQNGASFPDAKSASGDDAFDFVWITHVLSPPCRLRMPAESMLDVSPRPRKPALEKQPFLAPSLLEARFSAQKVAAKPSEGPILMNDR